MVSKNAPQGARTSFRPKNQSTFFRKNSNTPTRVRVMVKRPLNVIKLAKGASATLDRLHFDFIWVRKIKRRPSAFPALPFNGLRKCELDGKKECSKSQV